MTQLSSKSVDWFRNFLHRLYERSVIIDLFTEVQNRPFIELSENRLLELRENGSDMIMEPGGIEEPGDIALAGTPENSDYVYLWEKKGDEYVIRHMSENTDGPPVHIQGIMPLTSDLISNYSSSSTGTTTAGLLLLNYLVLDRPFDGVIPYHDEAWDPGDLEDMFAQELREERVTASQVKEAYNNAYFVGSLSNIFTSTATRKSFTTDSRIQERKKELMEKYRGQLDDPLVAKAIEDELIKMDREFVGDDKASDFYDAMGSKSFELHRKKMFMAVGGIEGFEEGSPSYEFIANSLAEGWDAEDFPTIVNELRKGSYNRGVETQEGGALAKRVQRVFQNIEIIEDDCKTTRTMEITLTEDNIEAYRDRIIIDNGQKVRLTDDQMSRYTGSTVRMRSPLLCRTENGLCYTCCGHIYKTLQQKPITMHAAQVANRFMLQAMKAMHGTTIETVVVDPDEHLVRSES